MDQAWRVQRLFWLDAQANQRIVTDVGAFLRKRHGMATQRNRQSYETFGSQTSYSAKV